MRIIEWGWILIPEGKNIVGIRVPRFDTEHSKGREE
jgi:hypothetical protein